MKVSRRIGAPAAVIFRFLADPRRHTELDGSGMLRGAVSTAPVSGVGDVFVMKMYFSALGDYEMNNHVVEYELDRRIGWEPEAGRGHPGAAFDLGVLLLQEGDSAGAKDAFRRAEIPGVAALEK